MSKALEVAKLVEASLRLSISVDSGSLLSSTSALISFSCTDPYQSKPRSFTKHYNAFFPITPSKDSSFSNSRELRLALQEGEKKEDLYWELWNTSRLLKVKDLKKIHSYLAGNACFGKLAWSSDDKYVLYVAEGITKKPNGFWSGEENVGGTSVYKEHFGETLKYLTSPKLYLYDLGANEVKEVLGNDLFYPAQPCFRPGTGEYVVVGFEKTPYKLGMYAMLNRNNKLFKKSLGSEDIEEIGLPSNFMAALYPKFSPDGRHLSYFGVPAGSISHAMCMALAVYNLETRETSILIDIVHDYNENFNGIYGYHDTLSPYDWLDNNTIVFTTDHNASTLAFITDLSGNISSIEIPLQKPYSSNILDIHDSTILLKASNISTPSKVFKIHKADQLQVTEVENTLQVPATKEEVLINESLAKSLATVIPHKDSPLRSVLYCVPGNKNLFVNLHGGPHGSGMVAYNIATALRLALGFNTLVVNYRGSTGFGQSVLTQGLGNIGSLDVQDCIEAIDLAKEIAPADKVFVAGGSHGGFLSLHLASGKAFDGVIAMNPAADVASMTFATDITDWPFAEVLKTAQIHPPSPQNYADMYNASPVSKLGSVQSPVLLVAGGSDLRVPPIASMEVYKILKANNKDVKLLWYPDEGHALAGKEASNDITVNSLLWLLEKTEST